MEAQADGIVKRSITQGSFWPKDNDWTVLRVNTTQETKDQAVSYTETQVGDPYIYELSSGKSIKESCQKGVEKVIVILGTLREKIFD